MATALREPATTTKPARLAVAEPVCVDFVIDSLPPRMADLLDWLNREWDDHSAPQLDG